MTFEDSTIFHRRQCYCQCATKRWHNRITKHTHRETIAGSRKILQNQKKSAEKKTEFIRIERESSKNRKINNINRNRTSLFTWDFKRTLIYIMRVVGGHVFASRRFSVSVCVCVRVYAHTTENGYILYVHTYIIFDNESDRLLFRLAWLMNLDIVWVPFQ